MAAHTRSLGARHYPTRIAIYGLLIAWAIVCLFPIYWTFSTSFKVAVDVTQSHIIPWVDYTPDWKGWRSIGLSPDTIGEVSTAREEFLKSTADPRAFGPAKTLAMRMHAEGVDLEDEAAVRAFIERYNRSPASGGHPPGSRPRGRGKKGKGRR